MALARCDQVFGADIGGINQVLGRRQTLGHESGEDRLGAPGFVDVGWRRVGVQQQSRRARVAGLGKMHHVASPVSAAFGSEAGVNIVGGLDWVTRTAAPHAPQPDLWWRFRTEIPLEAIVLLCLDSHDLALVKPKLLERADELSFWLP